MFPDQPQTLCIREGGTRSAVKCGISSPRKFSRQALKSFACVLYAPMLSLSQYAAPTYYQVHTAYTTPGLMSAICRHHASLTRIGKPIEVHQHVYSPEQRAITLSSPLACPTARWGVVGCVENSGT